VLAKLRSAVVAAEPSSDGRDESGRDGRRP
jgi:hypothetical protein